MNDDEAFMGCIVTIGILLLFLFLAVIIYSSIIYFLWPIIIPTVFPGLVEAGYIVSTLSFWESLGVGILSCALFGQRTTNYKYK